MRAFVTGGAGFVGSNLADALVASGNEVLAFDDLSTGGRHNLDGALERGATLRVGDVTDADAVLDAISGFRPDVIFHLAAQVDVRKAVEDPGGDARTNVLGTLNVLEAAHRTGGVPVVFASTGGAIYGEGENRRLPLGEDAEQRPETAYGVGKLCGEHYLDLYRRLHGQPGLALRFGNVFGPRQDPYGEAGVVAIFCAKLLVGEAPTIYGDGRQTRDFVFVGDVVEALLLAGRELLNRGSALGGPLNIATGIETSVLDLVAGLRTVGGDQLEPRFGPARVGEVLRSVLDTTAAERELGWRAHTPLVDGLAATYEAIKGSRPQPRLG